MRFYIEADAQKNPQNIHSLQKRKNKQINRWLYQMINQQTHLQTDNWIQKWTKE